MRGSRKFCQRGSKILVDEGRGSKDQNITKMAFRWRADDGLTLNDGLVAL